MSFWRTLWAEAKAMMFRAPLMITCAEFEDFILDYEEERLTPIQKRVFELHLAVCANCRSYLRAYRATVVAGKAAFKVPDAPVPSEVPDDLVKAILAARQSD